MSNDQIRTTISFESGTFGVIAKMKTFTYLGQEIITSAYISRNLREIINSASCSRQK